jgi:hypothetical protein
MMINQATQAASAYLAPYLDRPSSKVGKGVRSDP